VSKSSACVSPQSRVLTNFVFQSIQVGEDRLLTNVDDAKVRRGGKADDGVFYTLARFSFRFNAAPSMRKEGSILDWSICAQFLPHYLFFFIKLVTPMPRSNACFAECILCRCHLHHPPFRLHEGLSEFLSRYQLQYIYPSLACRSSGTSVSALVREMGVVEDVVHQENYDFIAHFAPKIHKAA
jgi:hypothetical protein